MKKVFYLILSLVGWVSLMSVSGCEYQPDSNKIVAEKQEKQIKEAVAQTSLPAITHWTELKQLKMIYELRDQEKLICYAYRESAFTGKLIFFGKCIGFGLPYSTQFSNPMKTVNTSTCGIEQLPQTEPNGLFMPESAEATWILLINPKTNEPEPIYCEPKIIISPFPLENVSLTPNIQ